MELSAKRTEASLVTDAFDRLRKMPGVRVCCDVPLLGRCVDLVYSKDNSVISLEFKLHDWRRAIIQARDHLLGVDRAYVCMPRRAVPQVMRTELERAGVGLMHFSEHGDWPFEIIIEAPVSGETWAAARSRVWTYLCIEETDIQ